MAAADVRPKAADETAWTATFLGVCGAARYRSAWSSSGCGVTDMVELLNCRRPGTQEDRLRGTNRKLTILTSGFRRAPEAVVEVTRDYGLNRPVLSRHSKAYAVNAIWPAREHDMPRATWKGFLRCRWPTGPVRWCRVQSRDLRSSRTEHWLVISILRPR